MCDDNYWDSQARGAYIALKYIWERAEAHARNGKQGEELLEAWKTIQFEIQETQVSDIIPGMKR